MHSSKGFSLIELMIVVGIIGILSLIGMPIYKDYVTKVKLTELVVKHMYLTRQIEIELESGGIEEALSFMRGGCTSDINEIQDGWSVVYRTFQCATNMGIQSNGNLYVRISWDSFQPSNPISPTHGVPNLFIEIESYNKSKRESFLQRYVRNENTENHSLSYVPDSIVSIDDAYMGWARNKSLIFDFYKPAAGGSSIKIIDKNGDTHVADIGKWYCASGVADRPIGGEFYEEGLPKSIRPSMCRYSRIGYGPFIED